MLNIKTKKTLGQSSLEYAVIVAVAVAALLAMQVYIKRAISGSLRTQADRLGSQYDPLNTIANMTTTITSDVTTEVATTLNTNGAEPVLETTTTVTTDEETETITGTETVGDLGMSSF